MTAGDGDWGAFVPGRRCRREATGDGPLQGLRLAVKDLIDVAGEVTGGGNPDWASGQAPALSDAPAVVSLRADGAILVGKTVTDELAFSLEGENHFYGTPRNPNAPGCLPGGSSSGSAVAVAAGLADLALGTDTGGSVRIPASFCGVYGMRPSHGRISLQGAIPFAPSYDTIGWFAADAATLERAGQALFASQPRPVRALELRIASDAFELADPACSTAVLQWADRLSATVQVQAFEGDWRDWLQAYAVLQGLEIQASLGKWIARRQPGFGPAIAARFAGAVALDPREGDRWLAWRAAQTRRLHAALDGVAWLLPSAPCTALALNAGTGQRGTFYERALALGSLAGHAGLPQVSLPLARAGGLPVGVSLLAGPGEDESLLALASDIDRSIGT